MAAPHETNRAAFCTTQWTTVLKAKDQDSADYPAALQRLCSAYWFPLYALARRKGLQPEDAKDSVQGFFEALLEKHFLDSVERQKGKFRTFLITAFDRFRLNQFHHANRQKRGGGADIFSVDAATAEHRYSLEPQDPLSPDKLFDKNWAENLVQLALVRLRAEFLSAGEGERFERLKTTMMGQLSEVGYRELGAALGLSEGGVKTVVRRMRLRFSALLQAELLETLSNPDELKEELRYLLSCLH